MSKLFFYLGTITLVINQLRPYGVNISFSNIFYLLAGAAVFIEMILTNRSIKVWLPDHPFWIPAFFILIGGLISSFSAVSMTSSISVTVKEVFVFSIWMSIAIRLSKEGRSENIILILIYGALFTSIIAILDFVLGTDIGTLFVTRFQEENINYAAASRYGGALGHPNEQGMYLAVVIPLILDRLFSIPKGKFIKLLLNIIYLFIVIFGVIISGSFTAYLGVIVSGGIVLLFHSLKQKQILIMGFAIPFVYLVFLSYPNLLFDLPENISERLIRRDTFYRISEVTGPERIAYIEEGFALIVKSPLIGAGMDQSGTGGLEKSQMITSFYVHNTIVQSWVAGGLFAFVGTVMIYIISCRTALKSLTLRYRKKAIPYVLGLSSSIFGWTLMDMAQPNIYQRFKWVTVALLLGLIAVIEKDKVES